MTLINIEVPQKDKFSKTEKIVPQALHTLFQLLPETKSEIHENCILLKTKPVILRIPFSTNSQIPVNLKNIKDKRINVLK